jgi:hypothetical protein
MSTSLATGRLHHWAKRGLAGHSSPQRGTLTPEIQVHVTPNRPAERPTPQRFLPDQCVPRMAMFLVPCSAARLSVPIPMHALLPPVAWRLRK